MNAELQKKITFLQQEIKRKVFEGTAKAYNNEIKTHFSNHPSGMKTTLQHFKPLTINGSKSQQTIAIFDKGYPAVLQIGTGSHSGYAYPYDKTSGTFVSFAEEPNLEEWAKKNFRGYSSKMKGLKVGKSETTAFGNNYNQWVFRAGDALKANSSTRSIILAGLKQIKL